jgi:site-specific recombinase XerC
MAAMAENLAAAEELAPAAQHALEAFVAHLRDERGLSVHTVAAYRRDVTQFLAWGERPRQVDVRRVRGGDGPKDQRRHHAEAPGAGASERPEQVLLVVLVAFEDAAVGQDDLRSDQQIGRHP